MKVVMVTNNALEDKMGGHERYVRELSAALVRAGASVTIVAKRHNGSPPHELRPDGVVLERHRVPSKRTPFYAPLYPLYTAQGVIGRVRAAGPRAVVHAHMSVPAAPLTLSSRRYLLTFHAPVWRELLRERQGTYALPGPTQRPVVGALRRLEARVARRATKSVVLSEFMRTELGLLDAGAGERAEVLPGGLDDSRFHPGPARPALFDEPGPLLFSARRLTFRTGVDELLRAMPAILEREPGARLAIAGTGPMEPELRALATELEIDGTVRFLGRISDDDLVGWYRTAALVVMPTRELEGFGLTTAEALACGTPVVGTPAGATPELLAPLDPRLVTRDPSAGAIAAAIVELLADRDGLERLGAAARDRVLPAMGWDTIAQRYLALYENLG